jgi:hypothetical protein
MAVRASGTQFAESAERETSADGRCQGVERVLWVKVFAIAAATVG